MNTRGPRRRERPVYCFFFFFFLSYILPIQSMHDTVVLESHFHTYISRRHMYRHSPLWLAVLSGPWILPATWSFSFSDARIGETIIVREMAHLSCTCSRPWMWDQSRLLSPGPWEKVPSYGRQPDSIVSGSQPLSTCCCYHTSNTPLSSQSYLQIIYHWSILHAYI